MKKIPLFLFLVLLLSGSVSAQFLGKIVYERTEGDDDRMEVWISAEKIRFRATSLKSNKMSSMGVDANEFFYEPKIKKLTLLMKAEKTALEVDIVSLKQMMDGLAALSGGKQPEPKEVPPATVTRTKISRKMLGYEAYKVEIRPAEGDEMVDLWCSDKLKYDWRLLTDALSLGGYNSDPASSAWLSQNYVPLRLDFKKNDTVKSYEAVDVSTTVKTADFALPAGYTVMTFQQFMQAAMMKSMMGN